MTDRRTDPRRLPPDENAPNRRHVAIQMTALGLEFSSCVLGGMFAGYWLDEQLGTGPWIFLFLTFGGLGLAVYRMIQLIEKFNRARPDPEAR